MIFFFFFVSFFLFQTQRRVQNLDKTNNTYLVRLLFLSLLLFIYFVQKAVFFPKWINNHSVSYVHQWLEHFITRVKLIFKDNGHDKYFTPIRCLRHAWILCWLECVNTRNIPHLFKPFLRCKKRLYIAVNEWPKENVVRLISRNFCIWIYLFFYI